MENEKKKLPTNVYKWVRALRSGKYEQGVDYLKTYKTYCCLGVACQISKLGRWDENDYYITKSGRQDEILPSEVVEWLGLIDGKGKFCDSIDINGETAYSLTNLNDELNLNFNQIADIIEQHWDSLAK